MKKKTTKKSTSAKKHLPAVKKTINHAPKKHEQSFLGEVIDTIEHNPVVVGSMINAGANAVGKAIEIEQNVEHGVKKAKSWLIVIAIWFVILHIIMIAGIVFIAIKTL